MSWLFSQALVEAYSAASCLDGKPSVQLSVMPTPHKFWRNDKMMDFSKLSQFGLTCAVLTEQDGEALLTSYLADFLVRTYQQQAKGQESQASEAECGKKWHGLLAKYSPDTHSWKTAQCSLLEDLEQSLETWPKWGSMQNGECFQRETLADAIYVSEYGLSLPTTGANEYKGSGKNRFLGSDHFRGAKMSEALRNCETDPIYLNPSFAEAMMGWVPGWSVLEPLATGKFQEWWQQHSSCLESG